MKPRTLLVLAILTLGLGAFIFLVERDLPSTDERRERDKKVLGLDSTDDVQALVLRYGDVEVHLEKDPPLEKDADSEADLLGAAGDTWRLAEPLEARADAGEVESLLGRLVGLEKGRTLENIDPEQLGLAAPRATVVVVTRGGEHTLKLGGELPLSSDVVMQGDEPGVAYQVSGALDLVDTLTREPGDWRDRGLFTAARADIERVTLVDGEERILLVRRGDGETFWLESPVVDRADTQAMGGLLTTLVGLEATDFVEDVDPSTAGLESSEGGQVIEVGLEDEETPWRLELGQVVDVVSEEGGERWARLGSQLVRLDAAPLESALGRGVDAWRSPAWSSMQVFKVDRAVFEEAGETLELRREGGDWLRGDDKIDYATASDALYPLTEVRAERLVESETAVAEGFSLETPRLTVTLTSSDGHEEVLTLYPENGDLAAATTAGRDAVLLLPAAGAQRVIDQVKSLRTAEPLSPADTASEEG